MTRFLLRELITLTAIGLFVSTILVWSAILVTP